VDREAIGDAVGTNQSSNDFVTTFGGIKRPGGHVA
jgi:hypothetical protein